MPPMLNDRLIKNLKPRSTKYEIADVDNLTLVVYPSGKLSFTFRYRFDGKQHRKKLGFYPVLSLKDARIKARDLQSVLTQGINPKEEKEKRNDPTVSDFLVEHAERYLNKRLRQPGQPETLLRVNVIPYIGEKRLSDVTRRDIISILDRIVDRGSLVVANRTLSAIRRMFSFAVERGVIDPTRNPCLAITKNAAGGSEKSRTRFLTLPEIKTLWLKLEDPPFFRPAASVIKILLLTGLRVGEVCGALQSEIEGDTWTIPGSRTKNQMEHKVILTDLIKAEIEKLKFYSGKSPYLIRSYRYKDGHIWSGIITRSIQDNIEYLGIDQFTPHDLRRTVSTHLNELGVEPWIVEKILNHKMDGVMAVYNKAEYLEQRKEAMTMWTEKIKQVVYGEKVIQMKHKPA